MRWIERAIARLVARDGERWLGWTGLVGAAAALIMALRVVPPDSTQGDVQRLMYIHVPAAWLAYMAFGIVFVCSIAYLRTKKPKWDTMAAAAAEAGVLFTVLTIALGSLWGKPVWGTWWTWDPRLTTTAIMLLIYVGYLAVRRLPDNPLRRARWAAVVGIAGFLDVPIVHLSVVWWRSLHQQATVLRPGDPTIAPIMLATLLLSLAAFTLVFFYLVALRMRVDRLERVAVNRAIGRSLDAPVELLEVPAHAAPKERGTEVIFHG